MKKIITLLLGSLIILISSVGLISTVNAVELKDYKFDTGENLNMGGDDQGQKYFKDESQSPIVSFILRIINFALRIMGALAVVILIIGGFMMMVAQGNEQQLEAGRDTVKYAAIGLIVAFLSYIIVIFVQSLFVSRETEEAANPAPAAFIIEKNEKFI